MAEDPDKGICEQCRNPHCITIWDADRQRDVSARFCGKSCGEKAWREAWKRKNGEPYSRWYKRRQNEKIRRMREEILQECAEVAENVSIPVGKS